MCGVIFESAKKTEPVRWLIIEPLAAHNWNVSQLDSTEIPRPCSKSELIQLTRSGMCFAGPRWKSRCMISDVAIMMRAGQWPRVTPCAPAPPVHVSSGRCIMSHVTQPVRLSPQSPSQYERVTVREIFLNLYPWLPHTINVVTSDEQCHGYEIFCRVFIFRQNIASSDWAEELRSHKIANSMEITTVEWMIRDPGCKDEKQRNYQCMIFSFVCRSKQLKFYMKKTKLFKVIQINIKIVSLFQIKPA